MWAHKPRMAFVYTLIIRVDSVNKETTYTHGNIKWRFLDTPCSLAGK